MCDIGCGSIVDRLDAARPVKGTIQYLAPELVQQLASSSNCSNYNPFKSDVFSLGLVVL